MPLRPAVALALVTSLLLGQGAFGQGALAGETRARTILADRDEAPMTGKERRKACEARWRQLSASEKTAQGPDWPQFYSRCIKRLKAGPGRA